ncbi:MAG: enoyl-CoA hydratase/isomerase family protein [Gemmatimonadota bacterium]|nr:enoyl-CoA hydratase/isomerase family protein [Gemmatimonadota bacterium]MDE3004943.1 enoyl-CoA hydratase/isomerase family protein [Gemmatimonadota bacterium]MDE3013161.1 enoyl-CoA hydratase/isomerase family protein [Gemmatimonadota bacterium]
MIRNNLSGIRFERDTRTARITLNRPERHNALGADDVARMVEIFDEIEADPAIRVLLLTGAGDRTFCSGASLDQMSSGQMSGAIFDTMTNRLAALRVPTVCALNGDVYGGGAELALCCDFRIGVEAMRLSVPAARLGVCYPIGGLTRYVRRLGPSIANRMLLAAEDMDGVELLRIGFLTELVAREAFEDAVTDRIARLRDLAPLAVQGMKQIMRGIEEGSMDPLEASAIIDRCTTSDDLREGIAAWREGREPEFRGR